MANAVTIFRGTGGLNNKKDPARLVVDPDTAFQDLAAAYNVAIDFQGRVRRRQGFTATTISTTSSHSLWSDNEYCLFVTGDALTLVRENLTTKALRNVTIGARMDYCRVDDKVFYLNGYEKGYIKGEASWGWSKGTWKGPATSKQFSDPPIGQLLEWYNGRMFIADQNTIWASEAFAPNFFNLGDAWYKLPTRIRLLRAVADGLYVGDDQFVYYLPGHSAALGQRRVLEYPAVEGTVAKIDGSKVGQGELSGHNVLVFATTRGICMAGPNGVVWNLTEKRLDYPAARYGASLYNQELDEYIVTMDP